MGVNDPWRMTKPNADMVLTDVWSADDSNAYQHQLQAMELYNRQPVRRWQ